MTKLSIAVLCFITSLLLASCSHSSESKSSKGSISEFISFIPGNSLSKIRFYEGNDSAFVRMPLITNEDELLGKIHGKESFKTVSIHGKGSAFVEKLLQMQLHPNSDIPFQYVMDDTLVVITD